MSDEGKPDHTELLSEIRKLLAGKGGGSVDDAIGRTIDALNARIEDLQGRLAQAREKLPSEDAVILAPEEAEILAAYRKLGKPGDIAQKLEAVSALEEKLSARDREERYREAAEAHGFKVTVLTRLAAQDGLEVEEITTEGEGDEAQRVAMVRVGDAKPVPLADYAAEHWADLLPALQADVSTEGRKGGTPYPRQRPPTKDTGGEVTVEKIVEQKRGDRMYAGQF